MSGHRPDVLVVGLGPAGARAALYAARAGLSVLAVDRKRQPGVPVQCAEFVPAALDQEVRGLQDVTIQRVEDMATYLEDQSTPTVTPGFRGRILDRAGFDALLVAQARAAGADCRFGIRATVLAADGSLRLPDGSAVAPRLIVGADGPRSVVGRAIGAANREIVETRQARLPLAAPHARTDIFLSGATIGGYGWLFPRGRECNVGVGIVPEFRAWLGVFLRDLLLRLRREGRLADGLGACLTGGPIPVGGMAGPTGRLGRAPVMLAGDAAGLSNPITGGGIAAAVVSGALAGRAAAAWLGGDAAAVDDYAEELEAVFGRSLRHASARRRDLLGSYDGPGPGLPGLRRGWVGFDEYWQS